MTLRLLPGNRPREAAEEVRRQEMAVENVRSAAHRQEHLLEEYIKWTVNAERMLRSYFTSSSVESLLFTPRFWALQATLTSNWEPTWGLVEAEIVEQSRRLAAEKAVLDEGQTRWTRGRLLVTDTSALIHGPKLWDWHPAPDLGWRDSPVQIVIPMIVLDELDELKEHNKEHTRGRARRTLKWLSERLASSQSFHIRSGSIAEGPDGMTVRGDVYLDVLLDGPGHVRLPIADDEIVDRAAAIASLSGRDVTLVTNDVSQGYRGRMAGLAVSQVVNPIYDVDVQEQAKAAAKEQKAKDVAARRDEQEAGRGKRQSAAMPKLGPTS